MNPEIKNLWIEELRSGRHEQTTGVLCRTDGKKCCLGVLSHVAAEAGIVDRKVRETFSDSDVISYNGEAYLLPTAVLEWAGFDREHPQVRNSGAYNEEGGEITGLADLNDMAGWSFNQIADVIEEQL